MALVRKADLIGEIADRTGLQRKDARAVLEAMADLAHVELRSGRDFKVPNIGRLRTVELSERSGRSSIHGRDWRVPARKTVRMVVTRELREAVK